MKAPRIERTDRMVAGILVATALAVLVLAGCAGTARLEKPGALLWGEHCGRCHNVRTPSSLTDTDWDVAGTHMRVRANLSGEDARKIIEFLQSSN